MSKASECCIGWSSGDSAVLEECGVAIPGDDDGLWLPVEPPQVLGSVAGVAVGAAGGTVTVTVHGCKLVLSEAEASRLAVLVNRAVYTAMTQTHHVEVNRRAGVAAPVIKSRGGAAVREAGVVEPASDSPDAPGCAVGAVP